MRVIKDYESRVFISDFFLFTSFGFLFFTSACWASASTWPGTNDSQPNHSQLLLFYLASRVSENAFYSFSPRPRNLGEHDSHTTP